MPLPGVRRRLRWRKKSPVAPAVFLFAPVSAEYLIGYDDIIGDPAVLIFGLLIFGPLYGAPAVLIRETTRRAGRGWPSMLLLGLAFGLVQAGLVDQSLFNPAYRAIPYWDNLREPSPGFSGWLPTGVAFGAVVVWLVLVGRWSRRRGWGGLHVLAAAAGSLLGVAGAAFIVEPLGDVPATAKYVTNAVLLAIVLLLVIMAARAQRQSRIEEHAR